MPSAPLQLTTFPDQQCPYLPDRRATTEAFFSQAFDPARYHQLMDLGFRRSGRIVYRPACEGCRACVPIRIATESFAPTKSQRRAWRKNQDLLVTVGEPTPTQEKFELYRCYQADWHGKDEPNVETFVEFLYDSPVRTLEFCYRNPAGRLMAVGICDESPAESLSSVYLYHDPVESRRGIGIFSAMYEIEYARQHGLPYWYLGYWVEGCASMAYKASFGPHELLGPDGIWR